MGAGDRVAWPFYIVCDVSGSMHRKRRGREDDPTPFESMHDALFELVDFPDRNVEAADIAHIALVTFADDTDLVLPLRKMSDGVGFGQLPKGLYTNYARLFATLSDIVGADITRLVEHDLTVRRPAVFFITDGRPEVGGEPQPLEAWDEPLSRLKAIYAPRAGGLGVPIAVVALGFEGADCGNLSRIAQAPGVACIAEAGVASPGELMSDLIKSIFNSVTISFETGDLAYTPPRGMRLCE